MYNIMCTFDRSRQNEIIIPHPCSVYPIPLIEVFHTSIYMFNDMADFFFSMQPALDPYSSTICR